MKWLRLCRRVVAYGSVIYCATEYGFEFIKCEGPSMKPTIAQNLLLAERVSVRLRNVQRGDIVTCSDPRKPTNLICKRVVAMEGDTVLGNQIIPRGHVWLQGDNRDNSLDSIAFGPVPYALIRSRVVLKLWPPKEFGWLSSHWFHRRPSSEISEDM